MNQREKRGESSLRRRLGQQCAPHVDASELILEFRLREQALRIGDLENARQAGLVACARLRFALLRV